MAEVHHEGQPGGDGALWYFDFISPFAYLQWQRLRAEPLDVPLVPRPILFAALLDHWGQLGPAEIPEKRRFTYRHVAWQAARSGITLRFPPAHPFNPLAALRLCLALRCAADAVTAIFDHIWRDGLAGDSLEALAPVAARFGLGDAAAAVDASVKAALKANTEAAIEARVFGVPTVAVGGELFWGDDATGMVREFLKDRGMFGSEGMRRVDGVPVGVARV